MKRVMLLLVPMLMAPTGDPCCCCTSLLEDAGVLQVGQPVTFSVEVDRGLDHVVHVRALSAVELCLPEGRTERCEVVSDGVIDWTPSETGIAEITLEAPADRYSRGDTVDYEIAVGVESLNP